MTSRNGKYYQRRWQIGFDGKETNVDEKQVDFVIGSGNHSRNYLHLTAQKTLQVLPLSWYAEKGGYCDAGGEQEFREAVRSQPGIAEWRLNLGRVLATRGEVAEARFQFEHAIRFSSNTEVRAEASQLLQQLGR